LIFCFLLVNSFVWTPLRENPVAFWGDGYSSGGRSFVDECLAKSKLLGISAFLLPLGFSREKDAFLMPDPVVVPTDLPTEFSTDLSTGRAGAGLGAAAGRRRVSGSGFATAPLQGLTIRVVHHDAVGLRPPFPPRPFRLTYCSRSNVSYSHPGRDRPFGVPRIFPFPPS
jgi:hypothetical protein